MIFIVICIQIAKMGDNMLKISVDYNSKINYVTSLNNVPLVRNINIVNMSDVDYENIKLEIVLPSQLNKNNYVKSISLPADSYVNHKVYEHIKIDLSFLNTVEEALKLEFDVRILQADNLIINQVCEFEILPYNHWLGVSIRPDLIASFIAPNNYNISKIISEAANIARENNFSMSAYQSGLEENVQKQINAVFEAIKKLNINYISLPASFEKVGQKIRAIDEIIENRIANCLDIAILAASCLEAVGLNSFIIVVKGHAFVGAWLEDKSYSDSIIEDYSFFSKRLAKGVKEVEVFESVLLTSNEKYTYQNAVIRAEEQIEIENNFQLAIDIKQARAMMIKPLPSLRNVLIEGSEELQVEKAKVFIPDFDYSKDEIILNDKSIRDKMQSWESKLLDLTLRNNLLNFIPRNRNISLVENDLSVLEDKLSTGAEFSILAAPEFMQTENRKDRLYSYTRLAKAEYLKFMNNEIKNNRLVSLNSKYELDRSLKMLYREAKVSIQENGSNALFLAIGFLKWFDSDSNQVPRYAPIILYPVEIVKKGGGSGYRIRYRDEEVQINTTLLEKIRNDLDIEIPSLQPLPVDENGINVNLILNTIRTAIKNKNRWDVVEWSYLGIFSFNQFVMWEDIRTRSNDLVNNDNIKRILGQTVCKQQADFNSDLKPLYLMPADSSQALAVKQSLNDESFVLYGPPGTGKSQTITNIIVSSLYNNKSVLFVAEKMAALEVVQERLNTVGLSDFSLELHSNKTKKSEVLSKIDQTLNVSQNGEILGFNDVLDKYQTTRAKAKELLLTVNKPLSNNLTLYEMINMYAEFIDEEDVILPKEVFKKFNKDNILKWQGYTNILQEHAKLLSTVKDHNLKVINASSMRMQDKRKLQLIVKDAQADLSILEKKILKLKEAKLINFSNDQLDKFIDFLEFMVSDQVYFSAFFKDITDDSIINIIEEINLIRSKKSKVLEMIEANLKFSFLNEDLELLKNTWQASELDWFLAKYLKQSKIRKIIDKHAVSSKINKEDIIKIIQDGLNYKILEAQLKDLVLENKDLFIETFASINIDWTDFDRRHKNSLALKSLILELSDLKIFDDYDKFKEIYINNRKSFKAKNQDIVNDIKLKFDQLLIIINEIDQIGESQLLSDDRLNWLAYIKSVIININAGYLELDLWLNYNSSKKQLIDEGFSEIVGLFEAKDKKYNIYNTIIKNVAYHYIVDVVDGDQSLYGFSGVVSDLKVNKVNVLKDKVNEFLKADLYEKLASQIPDNSFNANSDSEIGYLKKAIGNNGRGISLRELFDYAPNALRKLAPCMLMSPISVAQYISPSSPKFDLVIFDEASQVETHKAVGAISRGSQAIIVGDPKQLPPTSFFKANVPDESFEESDLPSILDELISLSFPEYYLKWHYRSNHESLITFSNQTYYDDSLYTFPSVDNRQKKVSNIMVDGVFGVPQPGQNIEEAKEILAYLKDLLVGKNDISRSIGIVTFNQPQSTLILDMIEEEMDVSKDFAAAVSNLPEELFVKNIENVQGDERDLIIFSIGFGPKKDKKMSMNFGPINQKGGSKRLNVAVTRAKDEMLVFSSFLASRIDLNRTSRKGPADLKNFLEYAQSNLTMHSNKLNNDNTNNHILNDLKVSLKAKGYESDVSVGTSNFKVDLAVVDKNNKDKYCAAIIIDGGFNEKDSLDDRVSTQEMMLNRLGWNTINLWSLDWFINKESTMSNIINRLESIGSNSKVIKSQDKDVKIKFKPLDNNDYYKYKSCYTDDYLKDIEYTSPNEFYISTRKQLRAGVLCTQVIKAEQPILFDDLCRKVMLKFDLSVLTDKMRKQFKDILLTTSMYLDKDDTLWTSKDYAKNYQAFRIPGEERAFNDIPDIEIKNAILFILKNQLSISLDGIYRETFNVFGYNMLGDKAKTRVKNIVNKMEKESIYKLNGQYNLKN